MKLLLSLALTLVAVQQANAQCPFTFCSGLANIPDLTLDINPFGDPSTGPVMTTCADVFDGAATPDRLTATECEQSVKLLETTCCPAQATTRECFLCGDSQAAFNTDDVECAYIDQTLSLLPSGDICNQAKMSSPRFPFYVPSYCGCPGATAPNTCKLCPDGQVVNAAAYAPGFELLGITCGDGAEEASHLIDDTLCASVTNNSTITAACCVSSGINLSISSLAATLIVGLAVSIL